MGSLVNNNNQGQKGFFFLMLSLTFLGTGSFVFGINLMSCTYFTAPDVVQEVQDQIVHKVYEVDGIRSSMYHEFTPDPTNVEHSSYFTPDQTNVEHNYADLAQIMLIVGSAVFGLMILVLIYKFLFCKNAGVDPDMGHVGL